MGAGLSWSRHADQMLVCPCSPPATFPHQSCAWVPQVGGEAWQQQHDAVVALNLQAHHNVSTHSDEFVKEALVLHDRLRVLVFNLLTHEVGFIFLVSICMTVRACSMSCKALPVYRLSCAIQQDCHGPSCAAALARCAHKVV